MKTENAAIIAKGLTKSFGEGASKVEVIRNLDFMLPEGSFYAIMGASGSGKSTLMHILAALIKPDAGSVEIGGKEITSMDDDSATIFRRRNIGIVFQDFNLIPTLTARENILIPLLLDRAKPDEKRLNAVAEALGITERLSHLPSELSGGERQRVAIARALVGNPSVILADEPTGNLDSPAAKSLCTILRSLNRDFHCSILMVTHAPEIAATADRVVILRDGAIVDSFETNSDARLVAEKYLSRAGRL